MGFLGFLKWPKSHLKSHENDQNPTKIPPISEGAPLYTSPSTFSPPLPQKEEGEVYRGTEKRKNPMKMAKIPNGNFIYPYGVMA